MSRHRLLLRLLFLVGIAAAVVWAALNRDQLDAAALDAWITGLGVWGPIVYVALYAAGAVAFVPGTVFALAGGALFGPVWGAALNLVGATIGASIAFLLARYLAGDWVARKTGGRLKRLINGVEAEGWRFVAFVRLVPLFPFFLMNYALGLTRISFAQYVIASFVCMAPGAIALTWLGHAGREALVGDVSAIRYGLAGLGLLAAIAFLPRLIRRLRTRPIAWIEQDELRRRLAADQAIEILDVRNRDEFDGELGHIRGARNVPLGELDERLDELRPIASEAIAVICLTDKRSASAAQALSDAGFTGVAVLRGGMKGWTALGFEAVRADAA